MIPRFFKDMPPRKPGRWVAVVIKTSPFRPDLEVWTRPVNGLRRAYLFARLRAWWVDMNMPHYDGIVGINWAVRKGE